MINVSCRNAALCIGFVFAQVGFLSSSQGSTFPTKKVIISEIPPFIEAIKKSKGFIYAGSYKLHNHVLPTADITLALEKMGKKDELKDKVVVILENFLTKEELKEGSKTIQDGDSFKTYRQLGIRLAASSSRFVSTHHKILVTQDYAYVGTTNFDKEFVEKNADGSLTVVRDFSIMLKEPTLIKELKQVVEDDRLNKSNIAHYDIHEITEGTSRLSWGPDQHCHHFKQLIQSATKSIQIYQQALQDQELTDLLAEAIKRGVRVSLLMSKYPFGAKHGNKSEACQRIIANTPSEDGQYMGNVRLTGELLIEGELKNKRLHIHAKVMIVDGDDPKTAIMYLGSANFYAPALRKDRNVGVITRDPAYIKPVQTQFKADWDTHKDFGISPTAK